MEKSINQSIITLWEGTTKPVSIEILAERKLDTTLLEKIKPAFCSIPWFETSCTDTTEIDKLPALTFARQLIGQGHTVLLHLTGRSLNSFQAYQILNVAKTIGVKNILALKGDPPKNEQKNAKCDFPYAVDLVRFIRKNFEDYFTIGVAGYPEKHPDAKDSEADLQFLKEKILGGADFIVTQTTFDYKILKQFSNGCRKHSINVPILAGVYLISSYKSLLAMIDYCSLKVPTSILEVVNKIKENDEAMHEYGVSQGLQLLQRIMEDDDLIKGAHLYSLNNLQIVNEVLEKLCKF